MLGYIESFRRLFLLNLLTQVFCLKDMRLSVPEVVAVGDTVTLSCFYDMENAALYVMRWYFESEEFYRYLPRQTPPTLTFSIPSEINVNVNKSTENIVVLRSVTKQQSGSYQCEVSADAPSFHTETETANMLVAELPTSEPVITIYGMPGTDNKRVVTLGETFKASCVSGPSYPPVNFTWIVNDIRFPSTHSGLREIEPSLDATDAKEAWSELLVHVDNQIITSPYHRKLIVRCETNIHEVYREAVEAELNVVEDSYWTYGGKVSPTIDQRGARGDPDNSALTGNGSKFILSSKLFLVNLLIYLINRWTL